MNIYIDDMFVGNDLESNVREYCAQGDFTLIKFEEVAERYTVDGTEYAIVNIEVE